MPLHFSIGLGQVQTSAFEKAKRSTELANLAATHLHSFLVSVAEKATNQHFQKRPGLESPQQQAVRSKACLRSSARKLKICYICYVASFEKMHGSSMCTMPAYKGILWHVAFFWPDFTAILWFWNTAPNVFLDKSTSLKRKKYMWRHQHAGPAWKMEKSVCVEPVCGFSLKWPKCAVDGGSPRYFWFDCFCWLQFQCWMFSFSLVSGNGEETISEYAVPLGLQPHCYFNFSWKYPPCFFWGGDVPN